MKCSSQYGLVVFWTILVTCRSNGGCVSMTQYGSIVVNWCFNCFWIEGKWWLKEAAIIFTSNCCLAAIRGGLLGFFWGGLIRLVMLETTTGSGSSHKFQAFPKIDDTGRAGVNQSEASGTSGLNKVDSRIQSRNEAVRRQRSSSSDRWMTLMWNGNLAPAIGLTSKIISGGLAYVTIKNTSPVSGVGSNEILRFALSDRTTMATRCIRCSNSRIWPIESEPFDIGTSASSSSAQTNKGRAKSCHSKERTSDCSWRKSSSITSESIEVTTGGSWDWRSSRNLMVKPWCRLEAASWAASTFIASNQCKRDEGRKTPSSYWCIQSKATFSHSTLFFSKMASVAKSSVRLSR